MAKPKFGRWILGGQMLATTVVGALALAGCAKDPDRWTAFVYPPGKSMAADDAEQAIYGRYPTFEACQAAAIGALRQHLRGMSDEGTDELGMGGYECGVGCRYEPKYSLYMCKETRK